MEDLPEKVRDYRATQEVPEGVDATALVSLDEMERRYILRVLEALGGSKTDPGHRSQDAGPQAGDLARRG